MATRSIVTSQPDVECDVCERRLLRGEQPDVFLAAGRRHLVCELCAPRAVQEGWMRETGEPARSPSAPPPRRRRGLLARLTARHLERASHPEDALAEPDPQEFAQPLAEDAQEPYDFLQTPVPLRTNGAQTPAQDGAAQAMDPAARPIDDATSPVAVRMGFDEDPALAALEGAVEHADPDLRQALDAFNAGEHPRRVAGVARALGEPVVSVRHSDHAPSIVAIVIAWELCWYRYEVDLDDARSGARAVGQGTELAELMRQERVANAVAEESGNLRLSRPGARTKPLDASAR